MRQSLKGAHVFGVAAVLLLLLLVSPRHAWAQG